MKRRLLLVAIGALVIVLAALVWPGLLFGPLEGISLERQDLKKSGNSNSQSSGPLLVQGSERKPTPEVEKQIGETADVLPDEREASVAKARIKKRLRLMEEANSQILGIIDVPEQLGAVAVIAKPTDTQITEIFSAIKQELSQASSDGTGYKELEVELKNLVSEYVTFESPKKVVVLLSSRNSDKKSFVEFTGIDEAAVEFTESGAFSITAPSMSGSPQVPRRYEYLFALTLRELEARK